METIEAPQAGERKSNQTARRIIIFIGDKGGVGKSMIARTLAEVHQRRNTGAYLVDGDGTTGSLSNHFGLPKSRNPDNPVNKFALHGTESDRDTIADLLEVEAQKIILDLPAASLTVLRRIESDYHWIDMLGERGWRPTVVSVITPLQDSIFDLRETMETFGDRADYIGAVNLGFAEGREDFALWDEGETRPKFLAGGGIEIEFPKLKLRVLAKLQQAGLTFAAGLERCPLRPADRIRLRDFNREAPAALMGAAEWLGLA